MSKWQIRANIWRHLSELWWILHFFMLTKKYWALKYPFLSTLKAVQIAVVVAVALQKRQNMNMLFSDWLLHNSLLMQHTQQQLATQQTSPGRMGNTSAAVWNVISAQKSVFLGRKQRKLLLSPDVNPGIIPAGFSPGLKALGVTTHGEQTLLIHVRKRGKQTSCETLLGHSTLPQHAAYFHE